METVILAAGHGKRMGSSGPKVLVNLLEKPIISYLVSSLKETGLSEKPIVVVGFEGEKVITVLGDGFRYVWQKEQLGTAHALMQAESAVDYSKNVLVLYGDQPNVKARTIKDIINRHRNTGADLTMATVTLPDWNDWRKGFYNFGRIVRKDGKLLKIVEKKDATEEELTVLEVNPSYFCIKGSWLWPALKKIGKANAQGEYYLTDIVGLAIAENRNIETLPVPAEETLGANTKEELQTLEKILTSKNYTLLN